MTHDPFPNERRRKSMPIKTYSRAMEGARLTITASVFGDGEPAYYRVKIENGPAFEVLCETFDALLAGAKATAVEEFDPDA